MKYVHRDGIVSDLLLVVVGLTLARAHLSAALGGSIVALLLLIQHACLIALTLLHRPVQVARPLMVGASITAWAGLLLPLLMRPVGSPGSMEIGTLLTALGSVGATTAMLSLGRSFGLEPANRGVRDRGLYRVVRHPIYAAYLLIIGGFLLSYPSLWNSLIATIWLSVQLRRIVAEEALLIRDVSYQTYARRVPYRLLPGLW